MHEIVLPTAELALVASGAKRALLRQHDARLREGDVLALRAGSGVQGTVFVIVTHIQSVPNTEQVVVSIKPKVSTGGMTAIRLDLEDDE